MRLFGLRDGSGLQASGVGESSRHPVGATQSSQIKKNTENECGEVFMTPVLSSSFLQMELVQFFH